MSKLTSNQNDSQWVSVDELLKVVDDQVDEESDADDEQQELQSLRQDRGDTYAWEAGYSAAWKTSATQGLDANQKNKCVFYPQKDQDGKVDEIKSLYVDRDNRVNRPYFEAFEYQAEQYFSSSRKKPNVMRSLVVILDYSESMKEPDYKPTRVTCLKSILEAFVVNYFKNSPISKLAFCLLTDRDALLISPLNGSPETLLKQLDELAKSEDQPKGDPSVQAGLERASLALDSSSDHSSKEILLIYGSCLTNDAGDISLTEKGLQRKHIRVSTISLAPEMKVLRNLCKETGGSFVVCMNRSHLREAILAHAVPQMELAPTTKSELLTMGFPDLTSMSTVSLCVCHNQLGFDGYLCPRCQIRCCNIPAECKACSLPLVSSIDIARCQVMDALPPPFIPLPENPFECCLCLRKVLTGGGQCPNCLSMVCFECDVLIHSTFKSCPGCAKEECLIRQGCPVPAKNPLQQVPVNHPMHTYLKNVVDLVSRRRIQLV